MARQPTAGSVIGSNGSGALPSHEPVQLTLMGRWQLLVGGASVPVPAAAQRLVALVALWGPKPRSAVAGTLWPEGTEQRALGSLRTALWRLQTSGLRVLAHENGSLALVPDLRVDVDDFLSCVRSIARGSGEPGIRQSAVVLCSGELLPGWYDDWVLLERERLHQLRLHALEALSDRLLRVGRHTEALEAALTAVAAEPLRESARRATVRVHLAERNSNEAVRQYAAYRELLRSELGVEPSTAMTELLRPYVPPQHRR